MNAPLFEAKQFQQKKYRIPLIHVPHNKNTTYFLTYRHCYHLGFKRTYLNISARRTIRSYENPLSQPHMHFIRSYHLHLDLQGKYRVARLETRIKLP